MRSKSAILNLMTSWLGQFSIVVLNLFTRKFFLNSLGEVYLGLNGLLANVISFLAMAELGIGSAITFSLYKPLANKDIDTLKVIMAFFKKVYCAIGVVIMAVGLALIPFLPVIIEENSDIEGLPIIYSILLFNTAITYFFSYKSTLLIADQKGFIFNINHYAWQFVKYGLQIGTLLFYKSYYAFLLVQFISTVLEYIVITIIANRKYPFLREKVIGKISDADKNEISKNTFSMVLSKVGSTLVNSTDNILIDVLVNISSVARFNNYTDISSAAGGFLQKGILATISSIGNFTVNENNERKNALFDMYSMICTWLYSLLAVFILFLVPPFVDVFYGNIYSLSIVVIICLSINNYFDGQKVLFNSFISAMGLYWEVKYVGIIEAVLNLVISIIFGKQFGVVGIVLGTLLSKLLFSLWIESKTVICKGLNESRRRYFLRFVRDTILVLLIVAMIYGCSLLLGSSSGYLYILVMAVLCLIIPNVVFLIAYGKSDSFNMFIRMAKGILRRR